MNLSPDWVKFLNLSGYEAVHWSERGDARASDPTIMAWARANGYLVFTNDLDFGALLATTESDGPSVLQVRMQDILPAALGNTVLDVLREHRTALESGALTPSMPGGPAFEFSRSEGLDAGSPSRAFADPPNTHHPRPAPKAHQARNQVRHIASTRAWVVADAIRLRVPR